MSNQEQQKPPPPPAPEPIADSGISPESDACDLNAPTITPQSSQDLEQRVTRIWHNTLQEQNTIRSSLCASSLGMERRRRTFTQNPVDSSGNFEILQQIGEGGVGVVHTARQRSMDRVVAIKMLRDHKHASPRAMDKFLREAVVTGDLEHPNIIPVYDLCQDDERGIFYAMKHVKGYSWFERIRELTLEENLDILLNVADAVAFAHDKGVIHRDLKPENVMLGEFGEVILMDWGLAAAVTPESKAGNAAAAAAGTPTYMAPEMALGNAESIGVGSDIYLLGAILYEIVSSLTPHTGPDLLQCLQNAAANKIQPTKKKGELIDVALQAMADRPEDRFSSVAEFQQKIRDYLLHRESLVLRQNAGEKLVSARSSGKYSDYAEAVFGLRQSRELWEQAPGITHDIAMAELDYARAAFANGDYDLALSLLEPDLELHRDLCRKVEKARDERHAYQQRLRKTVRVTTSLLLALIAIMPLIAGVVLAITYYHSRQALEEYSNQLIDQVAATTQERVDGFLATARNGAGLGQKLFNADIFDDNDVNRMEAYFAGFLSIHRSAAMIYFGTEEGNYFLVNRSPDGALNTMLVRREYDDQGREKSVTTLWRKRKPGSPLSEYHNEIDPNEKYDPRKRPWYQYWKKKTGEPGFSPAAGNVAHWTDVYVFHTGGKPGITASVPVFTAKGRLRGVFSIDITLTKLSLFLRELKIGRTGKAFILDAHDRIVAMPDVDALTIIKNLPNGKQKPQLRTLDTCSIPELASLAQDKHYQAMRANTCNQSYQQFHYSHANRQYLATLIPARNKIGSGWTIGVVVAEDDLLGFIKTTNRSLLWLIGAILLIGMLLALMLANIMSRSLKGLLG